MSAFGKIDIFVNNAGQSTRGPSETITDEMWQADFDLKLFAQVRFCRLIFPQMKERRWGRIIACSISAPRRPAPTARRPRSAAPRSSPSPRCCRRRARRTTCWPIRCMSGSSSATRSCAATSREGANVSLDDFIAQAGRAVPLGRMGRAEEFASIATFLASDAASYITGYVDQRRWRPLADLVGGPVEAAGPRRLTPRSGGARRGPRPCRRAGRIRSRSSRHSRVRRSAGTRTPSRSRRCPARAFPARRRAAYGR